MVPDQHLIIDDSSCRSPRSRRHEWVFTGDRVGSALDRWLRQTAVGLTRIRTTRHRTARRGAARRVRLTSLGDFTDHDRTERDQKYKQRFRPVDQLLYAAFGSSPRSRRRIFASASALDLDACRARSSLVHGAQSRDTNSMIHWRQWFAASNKTGPVGCCTDTSATAAGFTSRDPCAKRRCCCCTMNGRAEELGERLGGANRPFSIFSARAPRGICFY